MRTTSLAASAAEKVDFPAPLVPTTTTCSGAPRSASTQVMP
ncbi:MULTISPECIES: hypothetical protein [Pseudomonas]|nr:MULTISPECIES: hypothetical protein [Pseudomonas]MCS7619267.1 hypothetical protein [Pseudomonas aeruginosa]MCS7656158.1 hypothetical protein [Pseudomonas aeruginosa]MCS8076533.1 hypothetical protein [Pseudomonas aeruginosa]MCS8324614.1 hypothetical protein [Pseudomonas aeruginosa]MCS8484666.1 hypothetical protein [Pseudomonas aeruginosa]